MYQWCIKKFSDGGGAVGYFSVDFIKELRPLTFLKYSWGRKIQGLDDLYMVYDLSLIVWFSIWRLRGRRGPCLLMRDSRIHHGKRLRDQE